MATKKTAVKPSSSEVEEGKIFAFLGVFLGIIGFLIVLLAKKDNKYAMYYAKQGLVLTIVWVVFAVIVNVIFAAAYSIFFIGLIISSLGNLLLVVLWIIGWVYALGGTEKPIPVIGQFAEKIKL